MFPLRIKVSEPGKETVIVYVRDVVASLSPPGKRVRRFAKISLDPGQSRTLTFTLRPEDLSFIGLNNKPVVEAGDFEVMVGGLIGKFTLSMAAHSSQKRAKAYSLGWSEALRAEP